MRVHGLPAALWRAPRPRWSALVLLFPLLAAGCGGGGHARISVDHPVALWDVPLRISVSGLKPGEQTVLEATSRDAQGTPYVSSTPLTAGSTGRVELSGNAAMRVLWSLEPTGAKKAAFSFVAPRSGETVGLSVGHARTTVRRLTAAPGVRSRLVRRPFFGEYYAPAGTANRQPGILVFGGSEGGLSTTLIAQLYASHGYPTLALAYFGAPGLPRNLVRVPLEYFARALRWLRKQPGVDPAKLAVEGVSRGSEAAQLLGIHYPQLVHAVIALVPANGPLPGEIQDSGRQLNQAAWTFRGRPIPRRDTPFPFHDERIDGPIFLDCAGLDLAWPSCPMAQAIAARLHRHHFPHRVVLLDYPQAGHGAGPLIPNAIYSSDVDGGAHPDSNDEAAAEGWPKLLGFLRSLSRS